VPQLTRATALVTIEVVGIDEIAARFGDGLADDVLASAGRRLAGAVGAHGVLARTGRSRFGVLVDGTRPIAVATLATRLRAVLRGRVGPPADAVCLSATVTVS